MVIAFPRTLPDELRIVGMSFVPQPMQVVTPTRGGNQIAMDLGPTLWVGEFRSGVLTEEEFGIVRAWFDTLSSLEEFYGYDKLREYPLNYRETQWSGLFTGSPAVTPFEGSASLVNVVDDGLTVQVGSLPSGFKLRPGDYLAFDYGTISELRALHRVVSSADAALGVASVEVRPRVRDGWQPNSPSRTVMLHRPSARMVVVPNSYSETETPPFFGEISFRAIQTLGS
jgi:hypothetical protein